LASTVGLLGVAAPADQFGRSATPAATDAAVAVSIVTRRRERLNFLDFTDSSPLARRGRDAG